MGGFSRGGGERGKKLKSQYDDSMKQHSHIEES